MPPPRIATRRGAGTAAVCQSRPDRPTSRVSRPRRRRVPTSRRRAHRAAPSSRAANRRGACGLEHGGGGDDRQRGRGTKRGEEHARRTAARTARSAASARRPSPRRPTPRAYPGTHPHGCRTACTGRSPHGGSNAPRVARSTSGPGTRPDLGRPLRSATIPAPGLPERRERVDEPRPRCPAGSSTPGRAGSPARARSGCPRRRDAPSWRRQSTVTSHPLTDGTAGVCPTVSTHARASTARSTWFRRQPRSTPAASTASRCADSKRVDQSPAGSGANISARFAAIVAMGRGTHHPSLRRVPTHADTIRGADAGAVEQRPDGPVAPIDVDHGPPAARRGGVQRAEVVEEHQETAAIGDRVVDGDAQA